MEPSRLTSGKTPPALPPSGQTLARKKLETIQPADDHNFTWQLDKPEPLFEGYASSGWVAGMLSHEYMNDRGIEGYSDHPIGTGAFQFVELKIDFHTLYERVEDHWRKVPEFHELEFLYVKEDFHKAGHAAGRRVPHCGHSRRAYS